MSSRAAILYCFLFVEVTDVGQVWGWGYGGEGQLGLGSRIRMVSSPHPVPCIDSSFNKDRSMGLSRGNIGPEGQCFGITGSYVKAIACGGRHSAVITGLYVVYHCPSLFCLYVDSVAIRFVDSHELVENL